MVSIQRTSLGCLSNRLRGRGSGSGEGGDVGGGAMAAPGTSADKYQSLMSDLPAVVGLQEDVVVMGSNLGGSLATFVQVRRSSLPSLSLTHSTFHRRREIFPELLER